MAIANSEEGPIIAPLSTDGGPRKIVALPDPIEEQVMPSAHVSNAAQASEQVVASPNEAFFLELPDSVEQLVSPQREARSRFLLSIVVPVFNEERSIVKTLERLLTMDLGEEFEICVVNDGSTDNTTRLLAGFSHPRLRIKNLTKNVGKGAAVREGIAYAGGTHLLIFDADDEYRASDIPALIAPIIEGRAEVVYGARRRGHNTMYPDFIHAFGNAVMTLAANLLYNAAMTDLHTCLKLIPTPLLRDLNLDENGFGLDTQITAEVLRRGFRPYEVPASYVGRTREQGKKIKATDALECFMILFRIRLKKQTSHAKRNISLAPSVTSSTS
jgi:hypothetical protein